MKQKNALFVLNNFLYLDPKHHFLVISVILNTETIQYDITVVPLRLDSCRSIVSSDMLYRFHVLILLSSLSVASSEFELLLAFFN